MSGDSADLPDMTQEKEDELVQQESFVARESRLGDLIAAGRRFLKLNNAEEATEALSDAAALSAELYGEGHEKTFDAIKYYGMATLELAKQDKEENKEATGETEKKEEEEEAEQSDKEDGEESGDEVEDDEDDSMKLSWDLLETARCISMVTIQKLESENGDPEEIGEWKLKHSDVMVLLGEHSLADGKYVQAQEDLALALDFQTALLPPTSRILAQTYALIANACTLDARYDETVQYFEKAKKILVDRVNEQKTKLGEDIEGPERVEVEEDLKDLEDMLPGLDASIADALSSAAQAEEVKQSIKAQFEGLTSVLSQLPQQENAAEEANDITNLVRRPTKRPTEPSEESDEAKKTKEEGTSQL
ncbi:unnamed protein product [Caenorhabditis sp. 36 PRJEB53466]|nr:unnamed protein product [Caenorhabditis sp. 36 PRJEB53466]